MDKTTISGDGSGLSDAIDDAIETLEEFKAAIERIDEVFAESDIQFVIEGEEIGRHVHDVFHPKHTHNPAPEHPEPGFTVDKAEYVREDDGGEVPGNWAGFSDRVVEFDLREDAGFEPWEPLTPNKCPKCGNVVLVAAADGVCDEPLYCVACREGVPIDEETIDRIDRIDNPYTEDHD